MPEIKQALSLIWHWSKNRCLSYICSDSISFPFLGEEEIARIFKRDAEGWMFEGTCGSV